MRAEEKVEKKCEIPSRFVWHTLELKWGLFTDEITTTGDEKNFEFQPEKSTSDNAIRWLGKLSTAHHRWLCRRFSRAKSGFECRPRARMMSVRMESMWRVEHSHFSKREFSTKKGIFPIFHSKLRCKINRWAKLSSRDYWKRLKIEDEMMAVPKEEYKKKRKKTAAPKLARRHRKKKLGRK